MSEFEAWLEFQRGERVEPRKPLKCDECGELRLDTDLWGEDSDTGEQILMCPKCAGVLEMAELVAAGEPVDCLVKFDGKLTPNCLHCSWFISEAYGTLLLDGRVLWGDKEVIPPTYERVE